MKKITKKKTLTAVTGATVIGVAAAALVNGSKLDSVFNPGKFEKFENNYKSEEYDYVAGDGEETDIAGDNVKDKQKTSGDDLQVLQLKKQENGDLKDNSSFGISDSANDQKQDDSADSQNNENAANGVELSQADNTDNTEKTIQNSNGANGNGSFVNKAGNGNGSDGNGSGGGNSQTKVTGTPTPTPGTGGTPTVTPAPTSAPVSTPTPAATPTPTQAPAEPTPAEPTPIPATPTPTQAPETPTPVPATPTPTPNPWKTDKDTVITEDGELVKLSAEITKEYYTFGETYQAEDGIVTATFKKDGKTKEKVLNYGGPDGYSVTLPTVEAGGRFATFSYRGMSASAYYTVLKSNLVLNYMVSYSNDNKIYSQNFPGTMLENSKGEEFYSALKKYTEVPYNYAKKGKYVDLVEVHKRYIAVLGDPAIQTAFHSDEAQNISANYKNIVFLENKDGYLTNMLQGFRWTSSNTLMDTERAYLYYPVANWDYLTRNVVDYISEVPDGYKIRRVTENEGTVQYTADQVLEKYTGTDSVLTVPMGVTKVKLNEKNTSVKTFAITQGVQEMDISSISENLPDLQEYQVADGDELHVDLSISDGILYSRDGKTLLSVPAGRKNVEIPATVTTLGKGCFDGLSKDAVVTFKGENPPVLKGETGFSGTIKVADSRYDLICKNYMFAFGKECGNLVFETENGQKDLYTYDSEHSILLEKNGDGVLAAIPQKTHGEYTVPENVRSVGAGAFADCGFLTDIILGENVEELKENSMVLSGRVVSVTVQNPDLKITDHIFGTSGTDKVNLDLKIYVPGEDYERMLESWGSILDPIYGEGTARALLYTENSSYIYEDGAKYQQIFTEGNIAYRLVRVYQTDRTAFRIKEGTVEIASGALYGCDDLEILLIPESVETAGEDFLGNLNSLEMVASKNKTLFKKETYGASSDVEILTAGDEFTGFGWDDGILYGSTADGWTLLNVPTDYTEHVKIWMNTTVLYKNAMKDCDFPNGFHIQDDMALQKIGDSCFENCKGEFYYDFTGCLNLTEIGDYAFRNCVNAPKIIVENSVKKIGKGAFYNCTALESVTAPGVVEIGDEAFYGCGSMMKTDIFSSVEVIGNSAFYGCSGLTEVVLPETLSSMGESCFENCTMLKRVVLDGTLQGISRYCFYGCRTLTDVVFQDSMTRSGTLQGIGVRAFGMCTSLETMDFSEQTTLEVMGASTFENCISLTTVRLPENLEQIPDYCFEGCENLSILQTKADHVTALGENIFGEREELPKFLHIWVKPEMVETYLNAYQPVLDPVYGEGTTAQVLGEINEKQEIIRGVLFENTEEGHVLKKASTELSGEYVLPEDTVGIAEDAFEGCDKITAFYTAEGTNVALGDRCFKGCTGLQLVRLLGNITEWGDETFMDCTSLVTLSLGNTGAQIPRIGTRAFKNCTSLARESQIEIRAAINVYGEECFAGCTSLAAVAYTVVARGSLQVIEDGAFRDCVSLKVLLTSQMSSLTYIGAYAFANCDTLKQPAVPAKVTHVGEGCFMDCDNIQYVSFYGAIEEYPKYCFKDCTKLIRTGGTAAAFNGLKRIGEEAYAGCASLSTSTSWNLGRYANLEQIGDRAFYGCSAMSDQVLDAKGNFVQNVILTGSLNQIGASAFDGCTAMHKLWLQATQPPVFGAFSISSMAEDYQILVPDSQEDGDSIYKTYLETLTGILGKDEAYRILDSFSDGAKARQAAAISEIEITVPGDGSADTVEAAGTTEEQETPGVIEEVPENPQPEEIPEEEPEKPEEPEDPGTTEEPEPSTDENISDGSSEETSQEQTEQSEQTEESITAVQQAESGKLTEEAKERES